MTVHIQKTSFVSLSHIDLSNILCALTSRRLRPTAHTSNPWLTWSCALLPYQWVWGKYEYKERNPLLLKIISWKATAVCPREVSHSEPPSRSPNCLSECLQSGDWALRLGKGCFQREISNHFYQAWAASQVGDLMKAIKPKPSLSVLLDHTTNWGTLF